MSKATEQSLISWRSNYDATHDNLHAHFEDFGKWDWCQVANEGVRVVNLMGDEDDEIKDGTPAAGVFKAVAAQASDGAFACVAAALGVDAKALRLTVAAWYEHQDELPAPVSPERLLELITENTHEHKEVSEAAAAPKKQSRRPR